MALTEETFDDKIELVGEFRHVQIRTATIIKRDGEEISRAFKRRVLNPDDDVSEENAEIKGITKSVWTKSIKEAYAAQVVKPEPEPSA